MKEFYDLDKNFEFNISSIASKFDMIFNLIELKLISIDEAKELFLAPILVCECGGEKSYTTHSSWCPKYL